MKSRKKIENMHYYVSIAFYICAIVCIFNSETRGLGITLISLGSATLGGGLSMHRHGKNDPYIKGNNSDKENSAKN